MILIFLAALMAACAGANLDRTYLPPHSAAHAGGSPGSIQPPLTRTLENPQQNLPSGGFINEHQGVVVDAASADTRASNQASGLGEPRVSYGSTDSKVGDAAFRVSSYQTHGTGNVATNAAHEEPDLSAFHQPPTSNTPGNIQIIGNFVPNTIKYHNDIEPNKFNYGFETDNGIKAAETGTANNKVQGGYSYTGDDGRVYSVTYVADEHGFRAQGSHFPTPPPIPLAILRSLEQNAKDEAAGIIDDGSYDAKKYNTNDDYSDYNGKYNDRHSNKFSKRPGFNANSNRLIHQNQQVFTSSNFNEQFGSNNDTSKDMALKPNLSFTSVSKLDKTNNRNTFSQSSHHNSISNIAIDSRNDIAANEDNVQLANTQGLTTSPGVFSSVSNVTQAKPLFQQELQTQTSFDKPQSNFVRPSSYDASLGVITSQSNSLGTKNNLGSVNSFTIGSNIQSAVDSSNKPTQVLTTDTSFIPAPSRNQQSSLSQSLTSVHSPSFVTHNPQQFHSNNRPITSTQNLNLPKTYFSATSAETFNPNQNTIAQNLNTKTPSFVTSYSSNVPTKQPAITLTTPFKSLENSSKNISTTIDSIKTESLGLTTVFDPTSTNSQVPYFQMQTDQIKITSPTQLPTTVNSNSFLDSSTSSFNTHAQTIYQNLDNTKVTSIPNNKLQVTQAILSSNRPIVNEFATNTQKQNFIQTTQLIGQSQSTDNSYSYNIPSKKFITPSAQSESNKFTSNLSSHFNKVTQPIITQSVFTNMPQDSIFSTQYQSQTGFIEYSTQPTTSADSFNIKKPISQFSLKPQQIQSNTPSRSSVTTSFDSETTPVGSTKENFMQQGQNTHFGGQSTTIQLPQRSFDTNENTIHQFHHPSTQSEKELYFKPSKFFPSTISSDTFNTQTQKAEKISTLSQNTNLEQYNTQTGTFDAKKTTISQYEQANTQLDDKLSTPGPTSTQSGNYDQTQYTQYNQMGTNFIQNNFNNKATTVSRIQGFDSQFPSRFGNKPSTIISSAPQTQSTEFNTQTTNEEFGFTNTLLPTTQFGDNKRTTISQFQNPSQLIPMAFNQPLTSTPSTTDYSQTQTLPESTQFGEIYDYKKPESDFSEPSRNEMNKFSQQVFGISQTGKPGLFNQQSQMNTRRPQYNQENEKISTVTQFTQYNPVTNNEYNIGSTLVSNPQDQSQEINKASTFEEIHDYTKSTENLPETEKAYTTGEIYDYTKPLQGLPETEKISTTGEIHDYTKPTQSIPEPNKFSTTAEIYDYTKPEQGLIEVEQMSTKGEIYEYTKPSQGLSETNKASTTDEIYEYTKPTHGLTETDKMSTTREIYENTKPEQGLPQEDTQGTQINIQSTENNFESKRPTTFQSIQPTPIHIIETLSSLEPQNTDATYQSTFSQEKLSSPKPLGSRPFPFQSACCKGLQNIQDTTTTTEVNPEVNQSTPNLFDHNRTTQIDEHKNLGETQDFNSHDFKDFDPQKGSQTYAGVGENFGGPRKPPCFDKTGYHY